MIKLSWDTLSSIVALLAIATLLCLESATNGGVKYYFEAVAKNNMPFRKWFLNVGQTRKYMTDAYWLTPFWNLLYSLNFIKYVSSLCVQVHPMHILIESGEE